ncbi:neuropeptide Y receptor type 5-like [Amphibalanus amphitrite]|uniref:neuropeptide Y receptor type 5-like n=1 Tax=Amphibalanus amphitrite TaxID=1232801 RepID=UPI001C8FC5BF|nr:neuropeptide Y receptor type 5-like [Amphibalanus amphitrite]XP_043222610.1 neuropeptide Y receptor type 5-like [Amphibalanus amphitrite]
MSSTESTTQFIPWSVSTSNSSQVREVILDVLGKKADSPNASQTVDEWVRKINNQVTIGADHSPAVSTLLQVLYWTLIVAGITINLLIWFIFIKKPKLRTTRNAFIVNLCTSDILLCCITMPFTLEFIIEAKWTFGLYLCKLMPLIQCSNILVATGTVIIIALDRYNTIVKSPCSCPKRLPPVVYICCLWLVSLALSSPLWMFYETEQVLFPDARWHGGRTFYVLYEVCSEKWPNHASRLAVTFGLLVIQYLAPIVTLAVTHSRIKAFLHQHMANGSIGNRIKTEIQRNRRVTLVLTLIVAVYAVSWLPYHLFSVSDELQAVWASSRNYNLVFAICHLLAMTSAVTNPVLYGLLNTNFQREWRQLVPRGLSSLCRGSETRRSEQPSGGPTNTVPMLTVQRQDQLSSTAVSILPTTDRAGRRRNDTQL